MTFDINKPVQYYNNGDVHPAAYIMTTTLDRVNHHLFKVNLGVKTVVRAINTETLKEKEYGSYSVRNVPDEKKKFWTLTIQYEPDKALYSETVKSDPNVVVGGDYPRWGRSYKIINIVEGEYEA